MRMLTGLMTTPPIFSFLDEPAAPERRPMTSGLDFVGETIMFRRMLVALVLVAITLAGISMTIGGMMSMEPTQAFALPL